MDWQLVGRQNPDTPSRVSPRRWEEETEDPDPEEMLDREEAEDLLDRAEALFGMPKGPTGQPPPKKYFN